nr:SDR family oxidoreductase [Butyrivibrio fibrisolvens]
MLHIASIVTVNPDYSQKVMDVNVSGTENIMRCAKSTKYQSLSIAHQQEQYLRKKKEP